MKKTVYAAAGLTAVMFFLGCQKPPAPEGPSNKSVTIKVGHVGHDHHLALFVAADNAGEYGRQNGISLRMLEDRRLYELTDGGRKIADVQIIKVGGGSKMPTALGQGIIEVGLGGVAPVLAAIDKGSPIKIIAPLHYKGDMFVVRPDFPAGTWQEFVQTAKGTRTPIRIGYKSPIAVAKIIFEEALKHEGISFAGDPSKTNAKVHLVNVKGGGKLNVALGGGLVDGYVGNNPYPAIGLQKKILRVICDLEDLPPGTFRDHPCCCVAARAEAMSSKSNAITGLLILMLQATETINNDVDSAAGSAARWIGTSKAVEKNSIATSGYSMDSSPQWRKHMAVWMDVMRRLGVFQGKLENIKEEAAADIVYDFSLLHKAKSELASRRSKK